MNLKDIPLIIALLAFIFISYENARFIVEEDEMVVITQFGKPVGETHKVPGEYFKIPFIQKTHYFMKHGILMEGIQEIPVHLWNQASRWASRVRKTAGTDLYTDDKSRRGSP